MKKVVGLVIGLVPVSVSAECVPSPDCASIGYTETSCDGNSLKCPFDTSKLYCPPCDSSFKYACSGDNITDGIGNACNNKYVACNCIAGATFLNGECICDTSCDVVGNIYYSDKTCSSCKISDKTPVGIVAYKDESKHLIISLENNIEMPWSATQKDAEGNTIIDRYTDLAGLYNYTNKDLALSDSQASGFDQTIVIVEAYGENATGVAAVYCYNYAPVGMESSKGQWYLPAVGELYNVVYNNKVSINKGFTALGMNSLKSGDHWSSSETNSSGALYVKSSDGSVTNIRGKANDCVVSCLLEI